MAAQAMNSMPRMGNALVAIGLVLTVTTTACGNSTEPAAAPKPTSTEPTSVSRTSTPEPTSVPSSSSTGVTAPGDTSSAGPGPCTASQLKISTKGASGGAGHSAFIILFEATGPSCKLMGYPGVDGVAADGTVLVSARRTLNGYVGGVTSGSPPEVVVTPGAPASALLEGLSGPTRDGGPCPQYVALAVTPPDGHDSVTLPVPASLCYPEIHPVLPGDTGGARGS